MGQPATPSPDAHRPSNRRVASSRLSFPEFLLPLPFPYPFSTSLASRYWLGWASHAPSLVQLAQGVASSTLYDFSRFEQHSTNLPKQTRGTLRAPPICNSVAPYQTRE